MLGDFNAHLGHLGGSHGLGHEPTPQGRLRKECADRYHLYAVSMSATSNGPNCTYFSGIDQIYQDHIQSAVSTYLGRKYASENLKDELLQISMSITQTAGILPTRKPPKERKRWYRDITLSRLSREEKETWDA